MATFLTTDSTLPRTARILLLFIALLLLPTGTPLAADQATAKNLEIVFFYSDTCPHCHRQMKLMRPLAANNPELTIHFHETSRDAEIWKKFLKDHAITAASVPRTQIGETAFIGYSEEAENLQYSDQYQAYFGNPTQIIKAIEQQLGRKVNLGEFVRPAAVDRILPPYWPMVLVLVYCASYLIFRKRLKDQSSMRLWLGGLATTAIVAVFLLLGNVSDAKIQAFAERFPYPLFVFTIALADGFNPCAFTVLVILLSLLTHTRGRRDMAIIGLTFIATSAVMYFLFIMAMVLIGSLFIERYGHILMVVLGVVITLAGLVNIKDYFFLHQGFSLGLSKEQQTLFSRKASAIVRDLRQGSGRLALAIVATITLAIFVNIIELGCTAMLPAVYMTTLVKKFTDYASYIFWTAIYAVVYIIPLLLILGNFIYLFNSVRISEETGRRLKLAAGSFMLFFGLVMIFRPNLLSFG
jgi:glutaredoxin